MNIENTEMQSEWMPVELAKSACEELAIAEVGAVVITLCGLGCNGS